MRISFIILLISLFSLPLLAQEIQQINEKQKTVALYDSIRTIASREKLYVHFDKATYLQSDTLWFKAYLVDATLNTPSSLSGLIYTEMTDTNGEVVERMRLPTVMGISWGSFVLKLEKYKPGDYTFRAYTNWMQNFGTSCFFKKEIKILSIINEPVTSVKEKLASAKPKKEDSTIKERIWDIDVQFLPESGKLITDVPQRIAFKALNSNGKGIKVSGEIIDTKQVKVGEFTSNDKGMGYFNLTPANDETYTAQMRYGSLSKTIPLPKPKAIGTIIKVTNNYASDSLKIMVFSNSKIEQNLVLIGQSRGMVCFTSKIKLTTAKMVKVSKDIFPTGVCQIILLNEEEKAINERNIFINHNDRLNLEISSIPTTYGVRDSIPIQLKVANAVGNPVEGSFSIAITDDNQVKKDVDNDATILSYLLLSSDLKGEIEGPGYYFGLPNEQKHNDLEALMLTQGWVSYHWDITKKPTYRSEKEYTISGSVSNAFNKPVVKGKITLLGSNKGFFMIDTLTNDKGEFSFDRLPLMDSASFVIQALNEKGKKGTLGIIVNEFEFSPPLALPSQKKQTYSFTEALDSATTNLITTKRQAYKANIGILLNEVTIKGKRTIKGSENRNGPGEADQILTEEDLEKVPKKSLLEVLKDNVKGFRQGFRQRGGSLTYFINTSMFRLIMDGIYVNDIENTLNYFSAEDIKGIEVMKYMRYSESYRNWFEDPRTRVESFAFVEVTTKQGVGPYIKKSANIYLLKPIKYGDLRTFYHPKYTSANKDNKTVDFRSTLYWNPNLMTDKSGTASTSFYSADKKGSYTVWIEGTDLQGNVGFKTMKLEIK